MAKEEGCLGATNTLSVIWVFYLAFYINNAKFDAEHAPSCIWSDDGTAPAPLLVAACGAAFLGGADPAARCAAAAVEYRDLTGIDGECTFFLHNTTGVPTCAATEAIESPVAAAMAAAMAATDPEREALVAENWRDMVFYLNVSCPS